MFTMHSLIIVGYLVIYLILRHHYSALMLRHKAILHQKDKSQMQQDLLSLFVLLLSFSFTSLVIVPMEYWFQSQDPLTMQHVDIYNTVESFSALVQIIGVSYSISKRLFLDINSSYSRRGGGDKRTSSLDVCESIMIREETSVVVDHDTSLSHT